MAKEAHYTFKTTILTNFTGVCVILIWAITAGEILFHIRIISLVPKMNHTRIKKRKNQYNCCFIFETTGVILPCYKISNSELFIMPHGDSSTTGFRDYI